MNTNKEELLSIVVRWAINYVACTHNRIGLLNVPRRTAEETFINVLGVPQHVGIDETNGWKSYTKNGIYMLSIIKDDTVTIEFRS